MFYTNVVVLKLLDHLIEFCSGLHTVYAVDIPQVMETLFRDAEGIPQYTNAMEVTQRKSKRAKLVIHDEYMHAVALKLLLQSGGYETETREWSKLPEDHQTWTAWNTTFQETYVSKRRSEAAREWEEKPFCGSAIFGATAEKTTNAQLRRSGTPTTARPSQLTNQMMDLLEGYLENIAAAATQTSAKGGPLAELADSLAISVDTVARQQQEIKRFYEQVNALKMRGTQETSVGTFPRWTTICTYHQNFNGLRS